MVNVMASFSLPKTEVFVSFFMEFLVSRLLILDFGVIVLTVLHIDCKNHKLSAPNNDLDSASSKSALYPLVRGLNFPTMLPLGLA